MAIEIIKRGAPPSERIYEGKCRCGTEIECKQSDVRPSPDQREPGPYVMCPVCDTHLWVRKKGSNIDPY